MWCIEESWGDKYKAMLVRYLFLKGTCGLGFLLIFQLVEPSNKVTFFFSILLKPLDKLLVAFPKTWWGLGLVI